MEGFGRFAREMCPTGDDGRGEAMPRCARNSTAGPGWTAGPKIGDRPGGKQGDRHGAEPEDQAGGALRRRRIGGCVLAMGVGEKTEGAGDVGVVGAAVGIVSVEPAVDGFAGGERAAEED